MKRRAAQSEYIASTRNNAQKVSTPANCPSEQKQIDAGSPATVRFAHQNTSASVQRSFRSAAQPMMVRRCDDGTHFSSIDNWANE